MSRSPDRRRSPGAPATNGWATTDWIDFLARGAGAAPSADPLRRLGWVGLGGWAASAGLALLLVGPLPAAVWSTGAPWTKLIYAVLLAGPAWVMASALGRPLLVASRLRPALAWALLAVAAMGVWGTWAWVQADAPMRPTALLGHSWWSCPWAVLGLALPTLGAGLWTLRDLAPTRPRAAGAAVGLLAGAMGAAGYAVACSETSPTFIAAWYTLGIGLSAALGALLGPRLLRW